MKCPEISKVSQLRLGPMKVPFFDLTAMHAEISVELDEAWQQVCRSTGFIGGHFVEQLEAEWAEYCGARYCVTQ